MGIFTGENKGKQVLWGIAVIAVAWYLFYELSKLEANGGSISMPVIIILIYKLCGKYVVSGIFTFVGLLMIVSGIKNILNPERELEFEVNDSPYVPYQEQEEEEPVLIANNFSEDSKNEEGKFVYVEESQNKTVVEKKQEFGVNKKYIYKSEEVGDSIITETIVNTNYSDYVSDVKNKKIYFETILLLMKFIQLNDKTVDITQNKFYILALENVGEIEDLDQAELETRIFENATHCALEFNFTEKESLLSNSVQVLKGKFLISPAITKFYSKLFDKMEISVANHEHYFFSLMN